MWLAVLVAVAAVAAGCSRPPAGHGARGNAREAQAPELVQVTVPADDPSAPPAPADAAPDAPATANSPYAAMPRKAVLSEDGKSMRIGDRTYQVYNAFDPIAPQGGLRVIDFAGTLDYYLWYYRIPGTRFLNVARIDMDMNIHYPPY
ncbi:MAG: hypothetical protein LBT74_07905 [Acidobacteriota bacterium]|nr:hypothetical protein [Acidobacteriota bacterium]